MAVNLQAAERVSLTAAVATVAAAAAADAMHAYCIAMQGSKLLMYSMTYNTNDRIVTLVMCRRRRHCRRYFCNAVVLVIEHDHNIVIW